MKLFITALLLVVNAIPAEAQMTFNKVETRVAFGAADQGNKGELMMDARNIRFTKDKGKTEYFSIPTNSVSDIFYARVSGRRIGAAIAVSPFLLFSKGRKHYMTLTFNDGQELVGAVEFKLHKSNYRPILRMIEQVTGLTMTYEQEGIKDSEQNVATRAGGATNPNDGVVDVTSDPVGAEVEIDGAYIGNSPRRSAVVPGEYEVKLRKNGYKDWKRKIAIKAGDTLEIHAEMESR